MESEPLLDRLRAAPRPTLILHPHPGQPRAIALLSGSFDPITTGHAALTGAAAKRTGSVALVYSVRALPKEGDVPPPLLEEHDRLAILNRFCHARQGHTLALCSHGLLADQVEAARREFPRAELHVVLGSDKLLQLFDPKWYLDRDAALSLLFAEASVLYAVRAGDEHAVETLLAHPDVGRWASRIGPLDIPPHVAAISSSAVRDALRRGFDVRAMVPEEVHPFLPSTRPPAP